MKAALYDATTDKLLGVAHLPDEISDPTVLVWNRAAFVRIGTMVAPAESRFRTVRYQTCTIQFLGTSEVEPA